MLDGTASTDQMPHMTLCKLILAQIDGFDPMLFKRFDHLVNLVCARFG